MNDPEERINIHPSVWGGPAWKFLQSIAAGYPKKPNIKEQEAFRNLAKSLEFLLPCERCRFNYAEDFPKTPLNTSSREGVATWVAEMKAKVDARVGTGTKTQQHQTSNYAVWILLAIVICAVFMWFASRKS